MSNIIIPKLHTFLDAKKALTRIVDPECSVHHDENESGPDKLKMRDKKTGKIYPFPALSPAAQEWRNDPKNLALMRAMNAAPHHRNSTDLYPGGVAPEAGTTGWQNYALASCNPCRGFSAEQYVPGTPSTGGATSLSYWIGLTIVNNTSTYLMQPVCYTASGVSSWTIYALIYDYNAGVYASDPGPTTVSPGNWAYPAMWWDGSGWNIIFYGQTTGLYFTGVPAGAASPVIVKEVHNYNYCTDINPYSSGITSCGFFNLVVKDGSGTDIASSVFWQALGSGSCGESTDISNANSLLKIILNN